MLFAKVSYYLIDFKEKSGAYPAIFTKSFQNSGFVHKNL
jgi:hypothetical protein